MYVIFLVLIVILVESGAEIVTKRSVDNKNSPFLPFLLYGLLGVTFYYVLRQIPKENLFVINAYWQMGALVVVSLYALFVLGEKATNLQKIGLIIGCFSIILVAYGSKSNKVQ